MNPIDEMIIILQRVKNCDKALNNLIQARDNLFFKEESCFDTRYKKHVHNLIVQSINLIEGEPNDQN